jgi:hypothetical protein
MKEIEGEEEEEEEEEEEQGGGSGGRGGGNKEGKKRLEFADTTIKVDRVVTSLKTLHFLRHSHTSQHQF